MKKLFVYGTLRSDCEAVHKLDSECLGLAELPGYALVHVGGFPGAVPLENHTTKGELHLFKSEVWDELLPMLHRYEGFRPGDLVNSLFVFEPQMNVWLPHTEEWHEDVGVYRFNYSGNSQGLVPNDDWREVFNNAVY